MASYRGCSRRARTHRGDSVCSCFGGEGFCLVAKGTEVPNTFSETKVSHPKLTHKSFFDVLHACCMVAAYDDIVDIEYDEDELAI